jgi:integrase
MPKSAHVPAYKLHKPSGQARVIIRGRQHYLGPYGSEESREKYGRLIAELAAGGRPDQAHDPGAKLLVVELVARYWDFAQGYYRKDGRPSAHLDAVRRNLRLLRQLYAHTPAGDFGPLALRAIQQKLIGERKCRTYINATCDIIRRVFKWGVSQELIPPSIYQALATVPGLRKGRSAAREPAPVLPVDNAVVDATLPELPPVVVDMVRFQRLTGCRPGEVCKLRPCDVDRSGEVWQYQPGDHKTAHLGRVRVVYIGPQAQDVLRPYLLRAADAYCFSPAESEQQRHAEMRAARKTRVQPSQQWRRKARPKRKPGDRYRKDAYTWAVRRAIARVNRKREEAAKKAGVEFTDADKLPRWAPNQLRHGVATRVRREYGLEAAQVVLGHAKADVTQVYAERDAKLAAGVMRAIG